MLNLVITCQKGQNEPMLSLTPGMIHMSDKVGASETGASEEGFCFNVSDVSMIAWNTIKQELKALLDPEFSKLQHF